MIERRYYDEASLRGSLDAFEERFGMDSRTFFAAYAANDDEQMAAISRWRRHSWASYYREWCRLSGEDLTAHVRRELELA
jgi:hypothetical protein